MSGAGEFERFWELVAEAERLQEEMRPLLRLLADARRKYMHTRSDADRLEMERIQRRASELAERHSALGEKMRRASGIPKEVLEEIDRPDLPSDGESQLLRKDLTEQRVAVTGLVDAYLAEALDEVRRLLAPGWLEDDDQIPHRIDGLIRGRECLSLVKGLRPESEFSRLHRLRQMIRVSEDYQNGHLAYDHFAGATIVPQLVQLGTRLNYLDRVGGDVQGRLRRLWEGNGKSTDAIVFELLVAAECAGYGRDIEFLSETHEKSPDIRCHDPYPMVIECKRKRVLSDYELAEEAAMRKLFAELEAEVVKKGLYGRFDLRLKIDARNAPVSQIVARMLSQRLAPYPNRELEYPWGSVAYHHLPYRLNLPGTTKLYSPHMLMAVFGWNTDLPEWDGIVCRVDSAGEPIVNAIRNPIALVWSNVSSAAVKKRAWSPLDLFGDAMGQIPPGESGIIYLAYHEGARQEVADRRTQNFLDHISEWEHAASIRVPISFLVRFYPRPLDHGNPDLIENTMMLRSSLYGDPGLFEYFPSAIFTRSPSKEVGRGSERS